MPADTATKTTPQTKATLKYLRTSAYKVPEVPDPIPGLDVDDARHVLQFSERGPAREVLKVLNSAVANADHTLNIPADELKVLVAYADEGPTIKRWRPRARGRADPGPQAPLPHHDHRGPPVRRRAPGAPPARRCVRHAAPPR